MKKTCSRLGCHNLVKDNRSIFCSRECRGADRRGSKVLNQWPQKRECKTCNVEFSVTSQQKDKRFCSRSCAATWNNTGRYTRPACPNCGKRPAQRSIYCSSACRSVHKIQQWLVGEWDATTKEGLSRTIRLYLIEQAKYKCSLCGWGEINPYTKKSTLQINHIDGRWNNNKPENLEVLCPNCHSLTSNFGALNKGNGREYRYAPVVQK